MYAVIKTGGHQYRVKEGDELTIDRLEGEVGSALNLEQVLLVGKEDSKRSRGNDDPQNYARALCCIGKAYPRNPSLQRP